MTLKRRDFISISAMAAATGMISGISSCNTGNKQDGKSASTSPWQSYQDGPAL